MTHKNSKSKRTKKKDRFLCLHCHRNKVGEPRSFAILSGGALFGTKKSSGPDARMFGFLSFDWHGAHTDMCDASMGKQIYPDQMTGVDVVPFDDNAGQFDLYFCSTPCLRAYLNEQVDLLESKMTFADADTRRTK